MRPQGKISEVLKCRFGVENLDVLLFWVQNKKKGHDVINCLSFNLTSLLCITSCFLVNTLHGLCVAIGHPISGLLFSDCWNIDYLTLSWFF